MKSQGSNRFRAVRKICIQDRIRILEVQITSNPDQTQLSWEAGEGYEVKLEGDQLIVSRSDPGSINIKEAVETILGQTYQDASQGVPNGVKLSLPRYKEVICSVQPSTITVDGQSTYYFWE